MIVNHDNTHQVLDTILAERRGQVIERTLLASVLSMLLDVNVDGVNAYEDEFEQPFLESTRNFYREESQTFLEQFTCSEYLDKAQSRLAEEASRSYLAPPTEAKLRATVESELITKHIKHLVEVYFLLIYI